MELFYSSEFYLDEGRGLCRLDPAESSHCCRVLRHRCGDRINVIDGEGTLYFCTLSDDNPRGAEATVDEKLEGWGDHPYHLTMAVCPTKNNDRYEWFCEKAVEIGVDEIVPLIGERSERKEYKTERARKIALSATKQSLKARIPLVREPMKVSEFIRGEESSPSLKMMAYCFEGEEQRRRSIKEVLSSLSLSEGKPRITIMIGPEGDFSPEEARLALSCGFIPVHLGESRLRTETAGVVATSAVYFAFL